jgi:hypothetical protein
MDDANANFISSNGLNVNPVKLDDFYQTEEEIVDEPSLADDLRANGYSEELIQKQAN